MHLQGNAFFNTYFQDIRSLFRAIKMTWKFVLALDPSTERCDLGISPVSTFVLQESQSSIQILII